MPRKPVAAHLTARTPRYTEATQASRPLLCPVPSAEIIGSRPAGNGSQLESIIRGSARSVSAVSRKHSRAVGGRYLRVLGMSAAVSSPVRGTPLI